MTILTDSRAASPHGAPATLASTMSESSGRTWALRRGVTFVQRFQAQIGGRPARLLVHMGNNQNPYNAHVRISAGDRVLVDLSCSACRQRQSDWATVFEFGDIAATVAAGEWLQFSVTPGADVGIEALALDRPDVKAGDLPGYGAMSARFALEGKTASHAAAHIQSVLGPDYVDGDQPIGGGVVLQAQNTRDVIIKKARWALPVNRFASAVLQNEATGLVVPVPPVVEGGPGDGEHNPVVIAIAPGAVAFGVEMDCYYRNRRPPDETVQDGGAFTVRAPTISDIDVQRNDAGIHRTSGGVLRVQAGNWGNDDGQRIPGVLVTVRVQFPAGETGEVGCIQLVNGNRTYTLPGGAQVVGASNGWYLDSRVPLSNNARRTNAPGGFVTFTMVDAPAQHLSDRAVRLDVDDQFRAYFCIRPDRPNAVWVPFGRVDWSWSARVERASLTAAWPATPQAQAVAAGQFQTVEPTCATMPMWTRNIIAVMNALKAQLNIDIRPPVSPWTRVGVGACLVLVVIAGGVTAAVLTRLEDETEAPTAPGPNGTSALIFGDPSVIPIAQRVPGVTSVLPAPPEGRYPHSSDPRQQARLDQQKRFQFNVSPQNLFGSNPAAVAAVSMVAPLSVAEVSDALIQAASDAGRSARRVALGLTSFILAFTDPPGDGLLRQMAGHPQIHSISVAMEMPDPPNPHPDPNPRQTDNM